MLQYCLKAGRGSRLSREGSLAVYLLRPPRNTLSEGAVFLLAFNLEDNPTNGLVFLINPLLEWYKAIIQIFLRKVVFSACATSLDTKFHGLPTQGVKLVIVSFVLNFPFFKCQGVLPSSFKVAFGGNILNPVWCLPDFICFSTFPQCVWSRRK